ncbi:hypothetical protein KIPB_014985, partial [Kipferlia bialata]|eukprot:g14985.t1
MGDVSVDHVPDYAPLKPKYVKVEVYGRGGLMTQPLVVGTEPEVEGTSKQKLKDAKAARLRGSE